jgi:hypothetical protein
MLINSAIARHNQLPANTQQRIVSALTESAQA